MPILWVGYVKWHYTNPLFAPPYFSFLLLRSTEGVEGHGGLCLLSYASDSGVARIFQRGGGGGQSEGANRSRGGWVPVSLLPAW